MVEMFHEDTGENFYLLYTAFRMLILVFVKTGRSSRIRAFWVS
jgi:hypothetical protein